MEMKTLTGPLLNELFEKTEVSEAAGSGRNRTQKICYRFIGYLWNFQLIILMPLIPQKHGRV